ncbi:hypothetical protein J6590_082084 [Homalodisca vitripennis]|nr:hypothetical protein J6590_082084 [Homalodisca vitripennis]
MLNVDKAVLLSYNVIVIIFIGCYWFKKWFSTVKMCASVKLSKEFAVFNTSNNIKGTGISKHLKSNTVTGRGNGAKLNISIQSILHRSPALIARGISEWYFPDLRSRLDRPTRDLRSGKYRSEMPLAISECGHWCPAPLAKKFLEIVPYVSSCSDDLLSRDLKKVEVDRCIGSCLPAVPPREWHGLGRRGRCRRSVSADQRDLRQCRSYRTGLGEHMSVHCAPSTATVTNGHIDCTWCFKFAPVRAREAGLSFATRMTISGHRHLVIVSNNGEEQWCERNVNDAYDIKFGGRVPS